jgi:hypothetical protein
MNTTRKSYTNHCEICGAEHRSAWTPAAQAKGNAPINCRKAECVTEASKRANAFIAARTAARVSTPHAPRREAQATGEWGMIGMMLGQVKKGGRTL